MNKLLLLLVLNILHLALSAQDLDYKQVKSEEFKQLTEAESGILLDVRTLNEYKNGHLKNAGQLNYYSFSFKRKLLLLPKDQPIYLYCNTGWRSERAAKILSRNGYKEIYNLEHGIMEWNLKNLPTIIDPDAEPDMNNYMSIHQYKQLINSEQKLILIDFYAPWCGPCRKMMPMIDSMSIRYKKEVDLIKINVDASKRLMKELKLLSVPSFMMYKKGLLVFSHNGVISREELMKQVEKNINNQMVFIEY